MPISVPPLTFNALYALLFELIRCHSSVPPQSKRDLRPWSAYLVLARSTSIIGLLGYDASSG